MAERSVGEAAVVIHDGSANTDAERPRTRVGTIDWADGNREPGSKKSIAVAEHTLAQKRAVVSKLSDQYGVTQMCTLMGLNRSSYYHVPQARSDDAELEQTLRKQAGRRPRDGYRRLTQTLRRRYKRYRTLNTKRVRRVMKQAGIQIKRRKKPRRTTNSQHAFQRYPNRVKNLLVDHPHQVWVETSLPLCWPMAPKYFWQF